MWFLNIFAANCPENSFFGIRPWYHYLNEADPPKLNSSCEFVGGFFTENSQGEEVLDFGVFTLAGLGILDILLRLAALVAVGFVVYGGIQYVVSQGDPEKAKNAQKTLVNALIGLGITVFAAVIVAFIGNTIGGA